MKKSAQSIYDPKKFLLQSSSLDDLKPKSSSKSMTKRRSTLKVKFEDQFKDLIAIGKVKRP